MGSPASEVDYTLFSPDWTGIYNEDRVRSLLEGQQFEGPGWYEAGGSTLLVLPIKLQKETFHRVLVWNSVGVRTVIDAVLALPVRKEGT